MTVTKKYRCDKLHQGLNKRYHDVIKGHTVNLIYQTACLAALFLASIEAQALDLKKDLSAEQFAAAGLNKLDSAELTQLQALINQRTQSAEDESRNSASEERPEIAKSAEPENSPQWLPARVEPKAEAFEAEVDAGFRGFSSKGSLITLTNGQVWEQQDSRRLSFSVKNRRVRVRPAMFGWRLMFLQNNESIAVKRVK
jgi:hypothetical protein